MRSLQATGIITLAHINLTCGCVCDADDVAAINCSQELPYLQLSLWKI